MSPSPQLAPAGSSTYSSNTMSVGDGTWDTQRNTFLLPNLVGLNFDTMRYNGGSSFLELADVKTTADKVRHGESISRADAISHPDPRSWDRRSHYIPLDSSIVDNDSSILRQATVLGIAIAHLASGHDIVVDDCHLRARLVCSWTREELDESPSRHWIGNICFGDSTNYRRMVDT